MLDPTISIRQKRKNFKHVENPYQTKAFPNIPRLLFLSLLLGIPTFLIARKSSQVLESNNEQQEHEYENDRLDLLGSVTSRLLDSDATESSFDNDVDPNLKTMTFTLPDETEPRTHEAYMQPDISTFYQDPPGTHQKKRPAFGGQASKFINNSPTYLTLYWDDGRDGTIIGSLPPFQAMGTASFPGHKFFLSTQNQHTGDAKDIVHRFRIEPDKHLYIYDAFSEGHKQVDKLSKNSLAMYTSQKNNIAFAEAYKSFTGRDWLSFYPERKKPVHKMWNADYFGQQHWVTSSETHYVIEPPEKLLETLNNDEMHRNRITDRDFRDMEEYRSGDEMFNMTMTVLSCSPRVFEIKNFLSHAEVDHIVHMATGMKLSLSTTSGADGRNAQSDTKTRTSKNSWVTRGRSPIMDSIYIRAADLMQIDEALLRNRDYSELPEVEHKGGIAEQLQLVHYAKSEQYTPHHDFAYPSSTKKGQPARFATLLLYLNEGMSGGETTFPRWVNSETSERLRVVPEVGKAVLFYDQLPDGNMDDFSQHAAEPVRQGEKWLINLWTWDPFLHI